MQDLENNNLIILDPLRNIYELYADLTLMGLLILNHFWIKQAEFCLKCTFVKGSFMFLIICWDISENSWRKNFINPSCLKNPKIINWDKKWHKFLFSHFFVVLQKGLILLSHQREMWKQKSSRQFFPFFWIGMTRVKTVFMLNSRFTPFMFL